MVRHRALNRDFRRRREGECPSIITSVIAVHKLYPPVIITPVIM
jgi:hypothetical protein